MVMNREAWRAVIHGVSKSQTRLSNWTELNWKWVKFFGGAWDKWVLHLLWMIHKIQPVKWSGPGHFWKFLSISSYAWRRKWQPTPVLLPGESHGQRSCYGVLEEGHDWVTSLSLFTFMHWRRKWQPTPVFLPGESQGTVEPGGLPSMGLPRVGHD